MRAFPRNRSFSGGGKCQSIGAIALLAVVVAACGDGVITNPPGANRRGTTGRGSGGTAGSVGTGGAGGAGVAGSSGFRDAAPADTDASGGAIGVDDTPLPPCMRTMMVSGTPAMNAAVSSAMAGDCILLADGTYTMGMVHATGTAEHPIVIRAANRGKAVVSTGSLDLHASSYVVVEGLTWNSGGNIQITDSDHCRISRCRVAPQDLTDVDWIDVEGKSDYNRIDHNDLGPKRHLSNMVMLGGVQAPAQVVQHTRIDHNYFHDITRGGGNGWETIRAGLSWLALSSGYTIIEYNLFQKCDGDPETISVKSSDVIVRYNTFRSTNGQITLRHGNRNLVYGNFMLGEGAASDGIRVCGQDHKIFNNYLQGLTNGTGILLEGGDSDAMNQAGTAHYRVYRTIVAYNTLVEAKGGINVGDGHQYAPVDCVIADNIVQGSSGSMITESRGVNTSYVGNIVNPLAGASRGIMKPPEQIKVLDPTLQKLGTIFKLSDGSPAIDAGTGDFPFVIDDMDGQARSKPDVGADEALPGTITRHPLELTDVGPDAP